MTRVAALDCGTNSLRMLVADVSGDELRELSRRMEIVRLGQGVDRTGQLAPDALARTFAVLRDYAAEARAAGAERVRLVATSATRDASNREEFVAGVREILGVDPDVVSGDEEAALSFIGATRGLEGYPAPYLVLDIGGGSTEFVLGTETPVAARSVDVGCVRLTERHLTSEPPTPEQVAAAVADVEAGISAARQAVPVEQARTLVGLAGSVTTVGALALRLSSYDASRTHHARISREQVAEVTRWLLGSTHEQRAARPVIHPGRVDVLPAGALVLRTVMERCGFGEIIVSEHDILDGIAAAMGD